MIGIIEGLMDNRLGQRAGDSRTDRGWNIIALQIKGQQRSGPAEVQSVNCVLCCVTANVLPFFREALHQVHCHSLNNFKEVLTQFFRFF